MMTAHPLKKLGLLPLMLGGLTFGGGLTQAAPPSTALIDPSVLADIRTWLLTPVVFITLNAQNERYRDLTADHILALDKQWRSEHGAKAQPLIASTLNNPLSTYLTQVQAASTGLFTEIFVIDAKGLNAGQSAVTTDFWQGDEAKFQKTFDVGAKAVFIDEPEFNEKSGIWRAQVNMTLENYEGVPIGAATIEVNLTELARRAQARAQLKG